MICSALVSSPILLMTSWTGLAWIVCIGVLSYIWNGHSKCDSIRSVNGESLLRRTKNKAYCFKLSSPSSNNLGTTWRTISSAVVYGYTTAVQYAVEVSRWIFISAEPETVLMRLEPGKFFASIFKKLLFAPKVKYYYIPKCRILKQLTRTRKKQSCHKSERKQIKRVVSNWVKIALYQYPHLEVGNM